MQRLTGCVCLHALSSFQRTDCWCAKDAPPGSPPLVGVTALPPFRTCPKGLAAWPFAACLGEPSEVTEPSTSCQRQKREPRPPRETTVEVERTPELGTLRWNYRQNFSRTERARSIPYLGTTVKSAGRGGSASGLSATRTTGLRSLDRGSIALEDPTCADCSHRRRPTARAAAPRFSTAPAAHA